MWEWRDLSWWLDGWRSLQVSVRVYRNVLRIDGTRYAQILVIVQKLWNKSVLYINCRFISPHSEILIPLCSATILFDWLSYFLLLYKRCTSKHLFLCCCFYLTMCFTHRRQCIICLSYKSQIQNSPQTIHKISEYFFLVYNERRIWICW